MPTTLIALHLRQRHREKMKTLETNIEAQKVAALEAARNELENRVRTLETIVTDGDRNLNERCPSIPPRPTAGSSNDRAEDALERDGKPRTHTAPLKRRRRFAC
jgi:hypothetical protein